MSTTHTKAFGFPDTVRDQGVRMVSKTRRLPDGRFEACAAIFAFGNRGLTVYAVAGSRNTARKYAEKATETQRQYKHALTSGLVRLTAA